MGEWMLCKERLPEVGERVLVCWDDGYIGIMCIGNIDEYIRWTREYMRYGLIVWQPLPMPWEGADND